MVGLPSLKASEKGQSVLIILLVMSVLLVVGLSVVSRSVTDIKISQQSQEAVRALWVAQTGLEKAIKADKGIDSTYVQDIEYSVEKRKLGGEKSFVFPEKVETNEAVNLWLVNYNNDTREPVISPVGIQGVTLYWGETEDTALEATLLYKYGTSYYFKRATYAPSSTCASNFGSAGGSGTVGSFTFRHSGTFDFGLLSGSIPILLKLRLLCNNQPQPIGVTVTSGSLPIQGACFESTAVATVSGITRKLRECQLWSSTPPIFDYLLFSGTNIVGEKPE